MKPSLKIKKRYIVYSFHDYKNKKIQIKEVIEEIFEKFFGVYGVLETGIKIVYLDEKKRKLILRCFRGMEDKVCFFFSLVNNYKGDPIRIELKGISGTINALEKEKGIKKLTKTKKKF